jgi:hypothetical protein
MRLVPLAFSLLSSSAFAIGVQFNFDVNSSAPSIYPCDAGVRHASHSSTICYVPGTYNACTPSETEGDLTCICSTPTSDEHLMDSMSAKVVSWPDSGTDTSSIPGTTVISGTSSFAKMNPTNEWTKQLRSLEFNFGSSRYGTEFYLDVCYRGPQVRGGNPNHEIFLQTTVTDLLAATYSFDSDLNVKASVECDLQNQGSSQGIPLSSDDLSSGIEVDFSYSTEYQSFSSGLTQVLMDRALNNGSPNIPRYCKIRYTFLENSRNDTDLESQLRKDARQSARISTLSDISPKNQ